MDERRKDVISRYYDAMAAEYARKYYHELDNKPFDREILARFSTMVREKGNVIDIGCGPGEVAVHLQNLGCSVVGIDLSATMVCLAEKLCPGIPFEQGDMTHLRFAGESIAGITAFYAIVHFEYEEVEAAFSELYRVLQPRGVLLIAFHIGSDVLRIQADDNPAVSIDFHFFDPKIIAKLLGEAEFEIVESTLRPAYPNIEYQSTRAYIMARKKGESVGSGS